MKRFYKFLMPLVAIVALALPVNVMGQTTCQIKVVGEDGYADGWNGGSLAIMQGTTTVATFNAANADNDGEGPELDSTTVTVTSGTPVTFVWTSGEYDDEVTIWIYDGAGTLVYTVNEPDAGTIYTMSSPCPSCLPPTGLAVDTTSGSVDISWTAGDGTAWQIAWGTVPFNPDTVTVNTAYVTSNSYSLGTLDEGQYRVYVRTDCGTDTSAWTSLTFFIGTEIMNMATSGSTTLTTCDAIIYDNGGPTGQYSNSCNASIVLYPANAGSYISVSGTSQTEGSWDYLTIYEGAGTSGEILFCDNTSGDNSTHTFGPFSSSAITVAFYSDGSAVYDGFQINVSCVEAPACQRPASIEVGYIGVDSVQLVWSDPNNNNWLVVYGPAGFNPDTATVNVLNVSDTTVYIENLEANTTYDFYMMALCSNGDTTQSRMISARTLAGAPISEFPYTCGFEVNEDGDDEGAAWVLENGTQPNAWYVGTATQNGGTKALYISNDNGTSNAYTNSSTSNVWAYAAFDFEAGQYILSYDWNATGESCCDYLKAYLMPADAVPTAGSSSAPSGSTQLGGNMNNVTAWQSVTRAFTIPTDGIYKIAFMWHNDGSVGTNPPAAVDNIQISRLTCPAPTALTVDTVAPTEIGVHWTSLGTENEWALMLGDSLITNITDTFYTVTGLDQYTYYTMSVYAVCDEGDTSLASSSISARTTVSCSWPTGLTATYIGQDTLIVTWHAGGEETEWEVAIGNDTPVSVYDSTYTFDGLSANTAYTVKVRSICGADDISAWTTGTFRTACGPISTLPWSEDFNSMSTTTSATTIPCWDYIGAGGYVNITSSYSHTGNCVRFYPSGSSTTDHVLVLPEFDAPISGLQMSFWTRPEGSSSSGSFSVGYVTNPASASSFVEVLNIPCAVGTTVTQYEVLFTGAPEGSRIAMRHNVGSTSWYWFVDDIDVHVAPECNHPVALSVLGSTATEATIGWGGEEDATFRVWFSAGSTCDTATATSVDIDSTHYTFTGLTENTTYTAVVATICDDGSLTSTLTLTFVTPEMGIDLPYATGFEATEDTAWVFANGSQSNQWFIGSAAGNPGNGLYISNDNGATNNYTVSSTTNVYAYRTFNFTAGQYAVSFDWRANGESCCDYLRAYLVPASVTLTAGTLYSGIGSTGTPAGWIALDGDSKMNVNSNWTTQQGVAIVPANATYRLVFVWHNDGSVGTAPAGAIDNISIVQLTCPQPTALAVDSVSTNSIDVSWTAGGSETQWKARIDNGAWQTVNTTPSYQFTGLPSGTNHFIEVQAVCGDDDESFITSLSTATLCAPISTLPYTETFDTWGTGSNVHAPNCYTYGSDYSSTYPYISSSYSLTAGGGAMYMYNYDNSHVGRSTWFALPMLDSTTANVNQTQLVFNSYVSTTSYVHKVRVGVNTTPSANGATWIDTVTGVYGQWTLHEVPFDSYTGNGRYIIVSSLVDSAYSYSYPYIDDLTLEMIPTCRRPDSLTVANATTTTVDLGWYDRSSATGWVIEYGPRGFQLGTGTTVTATSNPFTLTGLPSSFQGEYYVKAICGAGDTSDYSRRSCPFETTQIPATLPYNYDFENVAEWNNWQTSSNSETNNWYRGTSVADSGSNAMYIAAGDTASYFNYAFNAVVNAAAYRDIDFGTVDSSFTLSFRARVGGTTTAAYDGLMVFLVDPSIATTPSSSNITSPWGNVNDLYRIASVRLDTNWTTYEASFDTISGVHRVAFFWFNQNTGTSYTNIPQPAAVDNIHIKYASCPRPVNLEAVAGTTSANLTWEGPANATYEITYRRQGDTVNQVVTSNTNSYVLSGLTSPATYLAWVRKLCGAGDTSLYSDGVRFNTNCATITSFPWTETFEDDASLLCWQQEGDGLWELGEGDYSTSTGAHGGSQNVLINHSSTGDVTMLISPILSLSGSATLSFWHVQRNWVGDQDELRVYYRTSQTDTWHELASYTSDISSWTLDSIQLPVTSPTFQIAFEMTDGYGYGVAIDDITVNGIGGGLCEAPVILSDTTSETTATFTWDATAASEYEVAIVEGQWVEPENGTSVAALTYTFNGLTANTTYTLGVRSVCGIENYSEWSTVTVTTDEHPCAVPTNLTFSDVTLTGATLSWTPGEAETQWEIHVTGTGYDQTFTASTNPYTLTGLASATEYTATVRALCSETAQSEWSDPVTFTTATCQPVSNVTVDNRTTTTAQVHWTAPAGVSNFDLEYGASGFAQGSGTHATATTNSITLSGLTPGTMYDVYVRSACGDNVYSSWSNAVSFETEEQEGIEDIANANIALYPNPATTTVTLTGISGQATVTVVDMNGRKNGEWRVENGELTIDLTGYAQGAYFVRITGEQVNAIRKLIVK